MKHKEHEVVQKEKNIYRGLYPLDGILLLLLLGVTQNQLWIKLMTLGVVLVFALFKKQWSLRCMPGPFYFYLLTPLIGLLAAALWGSFQFAAYPYVAAYGCLQWLAGGLGFLLLYQKMQRADALVAGNSIRVFTLLNFLASIIYLVAVMLQSGSWWPFALAHNPLFGPSTGDYIKGVFGGSSLVNAACSALLLLYFAGKKEYRWALLSAAALWLSGSNLIFLLSLFFLFLQVFFLKKSSRRQLVFVVIFGTGYLLTNFSNVRYLLQMSRQLGNPVSATDISADRNAGAYGTEPFQLRARDFPEPDAAHRQKAAAVLSALGAQPAAASQAANGNLPDTQQVQAAVQQLYGCSYRQLPPAHAGLPLKAYAVLQTLQYDWVHGRNFWLGAGMGNASGKLSMKVTGAGWHGHWPSGKAYVGAAFYETHLQDLLFMYSQEPAVHSIVNFPNNTYLQLLGDYGLAGILLFACCYLFFFWKKVRDCPPVNGPLLLLLLLLLATDYWLESITVTFVFETLLLLPQEKEKRHIPDS